MIILDTNVLSEVLRITPAPQVMQWMDSLKPNDVYVTSVTQAEMLLGVALLPKGKRRDALGAQVASLFDTHFKQRCLPFNANAATYYADIVADRQRAGKPISTEDAQIAAIACSVGFDLATRNVADFMGITGLALVNPWNAPNA
jgi:toxin FitB